VARVLLIHDSREGLVADLAAAVAEGVRTVDGAELIDRRLEDADRADLLVADALILGSPNWTGITGKLKSWLDETGDLWESGELAGKPASAFTAGWSPHGGLEATLLQLMHWVLGQGMVFVGIPWSERMRRSGSYYGATAAGNVNDDDRAQAHALGRRVASFAVRLEGSS
jgi:NAD(P)H dehydrogenase (quinone)